jgi:translation initiation factor RLI1
MAENKVKILPNFEALDELVEFFDNHDLGEYFDQMPEVDFEVDIKQQIYLITLETELANKLTEIAKSRRTSSEELVNTWVREKILEATTIEGP